MITSLTLPNDFQTVIDNANLAPTTKMQYKKALRNYLLTGARITDSIALSDYSRGLPRSSKSFLKSSIRLLTIGLTHDLKSSVTPDNLNQVQASLYRLEAINDSIQVQQVKGEKAHIWLSQKQVKDIMATCDNSLTGQRDWIVLGLLLGAGVRREELISSRFNDLIDLPMSGNGIRTCIQVKGKGAKDRTVPLKPVLAKRIKEWQSFIHAPDDSFICRSLGQSKILGDSISAIGLFAIVRKHGTLIGLPALDPHDLRRTFAQIGYEAGIPITQLSKQLGHSNIVTTQRYLNLDLNLITTVSDFISLD
jgi:integrase